MSLKQQEKQLFVYFLSSVSRFPLSPALCSLLGLSVCSPCAQCGTSLALRGQHRTCCWCVLPITLLCFSFTKTGRCSLRGQAGQSGTLATQTINWAFLGTNYSLSNCLVLFSPFTGNKWMDLQKQYSGTAETCSDNSICHSLLGSHQMDFQSTE